jgi:hypothetical protein
LFESFLKACNKGLAKTNATPFSANFAPVKSVVAGKGYAYAFAI